MIDVNELDAYVKNVWNNDPDSWEVQENFIRDLAATGSRWSNKKFVEVGPYRLFLVDEDGGPSEDGNNHHWTLIFKVEGSDQLFRIVTDYDSYEGNSWYGSVEEVESYEETVVFTRYRKIKV